MTDNTCRSRFGSCCSIRHQNSADSSPPAPPTSPGPRGGMLPSPAHGSGSSSLREWLEGHSLGRYASTFAYHHIAEDILPSLTEGDLNDMGVAAVGDRRRLLQAISALPAPPPPPPARRSCSRSPRPSRRVPRFSRPRSPSPAVVARASRRSRSRRAPRRTEERREGKEG